MSAATTASERRRRMLALALPATVTLIADPLLGMVDTAVVGRLGAAELGALGLANAVLATASWVFSFLVIGTTSTVARAVGAGRALDAAGRHVANAARIAVAIGAVLAILVVVLAPLVLTALGAVEELIAPGTTYLRVRAVGLPLLLLTFVGHGAFRGVLDTRTPLGVVAVANVVNLVLTLALVGPFGIAGVAAGTVAAEAVAVVLFALRLRTTGLVLTGHGAPRRDELAAVVTVSRDLFLRTGGLLLGFLAISAAAARVDALTAAAHQVVLQSFLFAAFALDGLAIAAQAMVSTALGAGDADEARRVARLTLRAGVIGGSSGAVLLAALGGVVPRVLTDQAEVLAVVAGAWLVAALVQATGGPVFALDGVMMGAEDYAYLRTWTLVGAAVGGVLAHVLAGGGAGLTGLWLAVHAMMVVRGVALVLRVRRASWARAAV